MDGVFQHGTPVYHFKVHPPLLTPSGLSQLTRFGGPPSPGHGGQHTKYVQIPPVLNYADMCNVVRDSKKYQEH